MAKAGEVNARHVPKEGNQRPHVTVQRLARASELVSRHVGSVLDDAGLTVDEWRVLTHLAATGGCTMSDLARAASLTGPTLTRVVDRLTSSAMCHRNADPTDRRRILVHLSPRGREAVNTYGSAVADAERRAVAVLDADEERLLAQLLSRIAPLA